MGSFSKTFYILTLWSLAVLFLYFSLSKVEFTKFFYDNDAFKNNLGNFLVAQKNSNNLRNNNHNIEKNESNMKYILQWTSPKGVPFVYMGVGQSGFIDRKCPYVNCYVTSDRLYLDDYTKFDVIAFSGPEVIRMPEKNLPRRRSPHQKFVFASLESSDNYPVCSNRFDGYFNWTWTYKLDSDARWGYVVVRDADNKIIGPNKEMHWMKLEDMDPVSEDLKEKIKSKTKAAAWFVSNCHSKRNRARIAKNLQDELKKYKLTVDIYGACGPNKCPRGENENECFEMLERDYFFYLSFENSFSEDYVTEKLVTALKHDVVPIVFGDANYTRFMPDEIYLDIRKMGEKKVAEKMNELINNLDVYYEYFKWKNHYSYYRRIESIETDDYCIFCSILNNDTKVNTNSVYRNFKEWWDPPDVHARRYLPESKRGSE